MSTFWNVIILLFSFSLISCQQADFYKKPELISADFKDDFYPTAKEKPIDFVPADPVVVNPTPVDPTPVDPVVVNPTPVDPTPVDPVVVDPTPVDPTPVDPVVVDPTPVDPTPVDPVVVNPTPVDPTPTPVEPEYKVVEETFQQNAQQQAKVDILWVVDNSGSMGDEQASLAYNFDLFIHDFLQKSVDFQMGITTTDVTRRHIGKDYKNALHFLSSANAQKDGDKFIDDFKSLIEVGTNGSWEEQGLKAMEAYLAANHLNANDKPFLRDDAYLAVVIISDEEEQSAEDADHYVNLLKQYKQHDGWAKVYSIVTVDDKNRRQWETVGQKYMDVAKATHGQIQDIKKDFHDILQDMGNAIVNLTKSFALGEKPADIDAIKVFVGTNEVYDWTYDAKINAIVFDEGSEPTAGSSIRVVFTVKK